MPVASTVAEGNDMHIRLERPATLPETCEVVGPDLDRIVEKDENFINECGYIIRNVDFNDKGQWKIAYGKKIRYLGVVEVSVVGKLYIITNYCGIHMKEYHIRLLNFVLQIARVKMLRTLFG